MFISDHDRKHPNTQTFALRLGVQLLSFLYTSGLAGLSSTGMDNGIFNLVSINPNSIITRLFVSSSMKYSHAL